jgi:hypothetical protein
LIAKEPEVGLHGSGQQPRGKSMPDLLLFGPTVSKPKLTRLGNQLLTAYCEQKKIPWWKCGKLGVDQGRC